MNAKSASQVPAKLDSPTAWLVVAATALSTFTVFGVSYSFGAFFTTIREEFDVSNSEVALLFSITTFVYFMLGAITGRLADRYGPRPVLVVGAVVMVVALIATSRVTSIWVGYITYGAGVGIGVACGYVPMVATVGAWFVKRRTAALGVAVAGIGLGTLIGSPTAKALINRYGWRTGYVIMAVAAGVLLLLASLGAKRPPPPAEAEPLPPLWGMIFNARFWSIYVASFFLSAALFVPFVFLDEYMESFGSARGALLIGIIGATSIVGRLGFGAIGTFLPLMRMYQLSFAILAVSYLIWLFADGDFTQMLVFTVVLGVGYGGFIALSPAVAAQMFGPLGLGGVLGALYTAAGFGGLVGPPLAGELLDREGYNVTIETAMWVALLSLPLLIAAEIFGRRHARSQLPKPLSTAEPATETSAAEALSPSVEEHPAVPPVVTTPVAPDAAMATASADPTATGTTSTSTASGTTGNVSTIGKYDSVLLLSFGGPEGPDDVMPFLRNVTAGRDVPEQRLKQVALQYLRHGGISPINQQNRELGLAISQELTERGYHVPIYLGNRNWHPFLPEALTEMVADGCRRSICVVTSAFSSYSGCRQYFENLAAARKEVPGAPVINRVRVFGNHPGFVGAVAARIEEARAGSSLPPNAPVVFTAHSLPLSMAAACDYETQLRDTAQAAAEMANWTGPVEVAYQSRSGNPATPWLEPDINDRLVELSADGHTAVLVVPLGFVSDHMEVIHDLDTVARSTARRHHLTMVRAKTVGTHPLLVAGLADLIEETAGLRSDRPAVGNLGARPDECALDCCPPGVPGSLGLPLAATSSALSQTPVTVAGS